MDSVAALNACAEEHLRNYIEPNSSRAFRVYDRLGDAATFEPVDALAPGLLDAPVRRADVIQMFSSDPSPFTRLLAAIRDLLDATDPTGPSFADLDLEDPVGAWSRVKKVLVLSDDTPGLKASKVTKMLHRKRPELVPIFDSKVALFYGETPRRPSLLWPKIQHDLRENRGQLEEWADGAITPDGRRISLLRVLDIVIWGHVFTGCER